METESCHSGSVAGPEQEGGSQLNFQTMLDAALTSALSKYDSIGTYFSDGMSVAAVAEMLAQEMRQDEDLRPSITTPFREEQLRKFVMQMVGKSYGLWKKGSCRVKNDDSRGQDSGMAWASIDNYATWVYEQVSAYRSAQPGEQTMMRRELERALLELPLHSATIKYDGTCFGKLDNGALSGRRHLVGKEAETYLNTSTAACRGCTIELVRAELSRVLCMELAPGSVCAWGELMCNPGYYNYLERGLSEKWICFGVVVKLPKLEDATDILALSEKLQEGGFAHSISPEGQKARLLLCPALRQLLTEAGCEVADGLPQSTHAEVVESMARSLRDGEHEGVVLVFRNPGGQASVRKWKNSTECQGASKRHAAQLRSLCVRDLADRGQLDARVADMVETMITVAEADTTVRKLGRNNVRKLQKDREQ
ncbi:unnamed protein product [Symbiodinium natans]|uniref:Uncharacterized protein n=1 Tax=Symbiodinium natans TaxID=878477 RepID=A0A812QIP0_9DINO|nr:unnamed protein product [Symbiodinium natans]